MADNYCVMNVQKQHRCDVKGLQDEANRTAKDYKNSVDANRTKDNIYLVKSEDWHRSINTALEEAGVKEDKNSVVLVTTLYSASPEWFLEHSRDDAVDYFKRCLAYEQKKGKVISAVLHFDETTPHMQVATVPIIDVPSQVCTPRWKKDTDGNEILDEDGNRVPEVYTSGKSKGKIKYKRENVLDENGNVVTHKGLNAFWLIGNKVKMSREQTVFWERCGEPFGMQRGEIRVIDGAEAKKRKDEATFTAERIIDDARREAASVEHGLKLRSQKLDNREKRLNLIDEEQDDREQKLDDRDRQQDEREAHQNARESILNKKEQTIQAGLQKLSEERAEVLGLKQQYEQGLSELSSVKNVHIIGKRAPGVGGNPTYYDGGPLYAHIERSQRKTQQLRRTARPSQATLDGRHSSTPYKHNDDEFEF